MLQWTGFQGFVDTDVEAVARRSEALTECKLWLSTSEERSERKTW